jgi:hypothetical protein
MADYPYPAVYRPPAPDLPAALQSQRAPWRAGWLPEGLFPEVDALRAEHVKILDALEKATATLKSLRVRYNAEDEAREAAISNGDEPPEVTGSAERKDALDEAQARVNVATNQLAEFVTRAAATFIANEQDWLTALAVQTADAEKVIREAEQAVLQAKRRQGEIAKRKAWVLRSSRPKAGRHLGFDAMPGAPEPAEDFATKFARAEDTEGAVA